MVRALGQLSGGVHHLSRAEVVAHQRRRIRCGFAQALNAGGYDATSIDAIARAAEVSKRTFYDCYDSKESAYLDLHEWLAARLLRTVREAREQEADPSVRGLAVLRATIRVAAAHPVLAQTWLLGVYPVTAEVTAVRTSAMDELRRVLAQDLKAAGLRARPRAAVEVSIGGVGELVRRTLATPGPHDLKTLVADLWEFLGVPA